LDIVNSDMTTRRYTLGIDVGTYSSKGILVGEDGSIIVEAQRPHDMAVPRPGWAEHDADGIWWEDLQVLCQRILEEARDKYQLTPRQIAAVGVSAIGPCVLPVGSDGNPLRPAILYGVDGRARKQIDTLNGLIGTDRIRRQSGSDLSSQSAGPKILWIRENEPEIWQKTWKVMTSTTYLVFRLTGKVAMDHYTAAFYGPLYDIKGQRWSEEAAEHICPVEMLPELRWTADVAGTISPEAAAATGLHPGTPVITGTADAGSEAVSAGVVSPGSTMLMYGSSLFIISVRDRLESGGIFWPAPFLFPGTYALAAAMSTTGSLTTWFRDNLAADSVAQEEHTGRSAYEILAEEASRVPAGSEGVLALPYFSGERTPINDPDARGAFVGINLRTTRAHLYRALLEGVGYGIRHNLEAMAESGLGTGSLTAVGGGTRNRMWIGMVNDILGRSQLVRRTIGAAFGDAILAAMAAGILSGPQDIDPWLAPAEETPRDEKNTAVYDRYYPLFRRLYTDTAGVIHQSGKIGTER
jgi:xylulokinase